MLRRIEQQTSQRGLIVPVLVVLLLVTLLVVGLVFLRVDKAEKVTFSTAQSYDIQGAMLKIANDTRERRIALSPESSQIYRLGSRVVLLKRLKNRNVDPFGEVALYLAEGLIPGGNRIKGHRIHRYSFVDTVPTGKIGDIRFGFWVEEME